MRIILRTIHLFVFFVPLQYFTLSAQNLVPNPGFEETVSNPDYGADGVNESPDWFGFGPSIDFFHDQYESPHRGPSTWRGFQTASEGEGFAGIIARSFGSFRDRKILAVKLTEPLVFDQIYDISFEVNLSDQSRWGIDGLGVVLLSEEPSEDEIDDYKYVLRNEYGNILQDTSKWIKVEGQYRGKGGEQYLLIGNFGRTDPFEVSDFIDPQIPWAYYFIDNVYLAPCPKPQITDFELDTALCQGQTIKIEGMKDAKNYLWSNGSVMSSQTFTEEGTFILDNHFDCMVVSQVFKVSFSDCNCTVEIPTLSNLNSFPIEVSPIVQDWGIHVFDAWGRIHYSARQDEIPTWLPEPASAPYFWVAKLSSLDANEQLFSNTISGRLIIQR